MSDRFAEIVDRQTATERQGEAERQACSKRDPAPRAGYGHGKTARKRVATRLAR